MPDTAQFAGGRLQSDILLGMKRVGDVLFSQSMPAQASANIQDIFQLEGEPLVQSQTRWLVADAAAISFAGAGYELANRPLSASPVKAYLLKSVTVTANKDCEFNIQIGVNSSAVVSGGGNAVTQVLSLYCLKGVPVTVDLGGLVLRGGSTQADVRAWLRSVDSTEKTNCVFTISLNGRQITDDLNFSATKTILAVSDSIWAGTGQTTKLANLPWSIRKFYADQGIDCRLLNKSISGSNSSGHDSWRDNGRYDGISNVALIAYCLGVNAAADAATEVANLNRWIAWKQANHPDAKMIVFGPTPVYDNTAETALATVRTALSGAVTAAADPNILYRSLAATFTRTVTGNYADTGAPYVHPNNASSLLVAADVVGWLGTALPAI
ncbi:SGNH/GDSL hydrolase family protein [Pseudorhizobium pelagicum]|uniref:Uncharacterized protein n=1 Tax=Pseudorhizobium pelagicum TaxID=1509405 RepID=A0A922T5F5_9HYPH|nr:SGNH/GDSL hydrolase family protein [Pseudorhizobium pelagicum]KEQ05757.1 hypothetical protein GV67_04210 [Pseudorhizobium pelagicum]KEQ06437.1 hypothetical protein GV68_07205 [Pseudorhizobium pelagicum]